MECKKCGKEMVLNGYAGYAGKGDKTWKEEYSYFCSDCDVRPQDGGYSKKHI